MVLNCSQSLSHCSASGITVDKSRVGPQTSSMFIVGRLHKERLGDQSTIYDGLVRDSPAIRSLALQLPYQVEIKSSCLIDLERGVTCEPSLTNSTLDTQSENMILLIWDWEHVIGPIQPCTDRSSEGIDNQDIQEDVLVAECDPDVGPATSEGTDNQDLEAHASDAEGDPAGLPTETITFKCMGAVKSLDSQEVLEQLAINIGRTPEARKMLRFVSALNQSVNMEAPGEGLATLYTVHQALANNTITAVRFNWIRFLLCFPRSGIGYYAAICITKVGHWSHKAKLCTS